MFLFSSSPRKKNEYTKCLWDRERVRARARVCVYVKNICMSTVSACVWVRVFLHMFVYSLYAHARANMSTDECLITSTWRRVEYDSQRRGNGLNQPLCVNRLIIELLCV